MGHCQRGEHWLVVGDPNPYDYEEDAAAADAAAWENPDGNWMKSSLTCGEPQNWSGGRT